MIKKVISIMVLMLIVFSLAACGTTGEVDLHAKLDGLQTQLERMGDKLAKMEDELSERNSAIEYMREQIEKRNKIIDDLKKELLDTVPRENEFGICYTLQEAYDYGYLARKDLEQIAYYHNNHKSYPENLNEDIVQSIKKSWAKKLRDEEAEYIPEYKVRIWEYYGTYNGCVVAIIDRIDAQYAAVHFYNPMIVGGVIFEFYGYGPRIFVWKKTNTDNTSKIKNIEFESERCINELSDTKPRNIIINSRFDFDKFLDENLVDKTEKQQFEQYDRGFFNNNALIICLYWATDARLETKIKYIISYDDWIYIEIESIIPDHLILADGSFVMNSDRYFIFDMVQVKKSDIIGINEITLSIDTGNGYTKSGNVEFNVAYSNMDLWREYKFNGVYINSIIMSIKSLDVMSQCLEEFKFSYDAEFFEENFLIVFMGSRGNGGSQLQNIEMQINDNIASIKINANNGILDVVREWAIVLEVKKKDFSSVKEIFLETDYYRPISILINFQNLLM